MARGHRHHVSLGDTLRGAVPTLGKALGGFCISSCVALAMPAHLIAGTALTITGWALFFGLRRRVK